MTRGWWVKLGIAIFVVLLSIWTIAPTFIMPAIPEGQEAPWYYKLLPTHKIKLGLDLRGGLSITIGVNTQKGLESESQIYVEDLKRMLEKEKIAFKSIEREINSSKIKVVLADLTKRVDLQNFIRTKFSIISLVEEPTAGEMIFDLTAEKQKDLEKYTIEQTLEMERNRIDQFGVAEASIQIVGGDRILIQLPGVDDITRAESILERTALLEFKLVDNSLASPNIAKMVDEAIKDGKITDKYKPAELNKALEGKIPAGTQVLWGEEKDKTTAEITRSFYLLKVNAELTGKFLEDARVQQGMYNEPVVGLSFNPGGAELFKKITTDNQGKLLAIVLDDKVSSAPRINEPIPDGRAQITFGGMMDRDSTLREAKDLVVVLKAGALPAPVEILETRVVGPTLGKDSIEWGAKSALIGTFIVVIFMLVYYGMGGLLADIALLLNLLFILAMMIAIDATLTLPGIAGIALTLGMAVDANVIINERIREEILSGKPLRNAIGAGFKRSFLTILDSNLTTLIAGFVLLQYGTGPIKGFAVTLIIGLIISFYTAFAIVKLLFEYYLAKKKSDQMYI
jgi:protein-export membrane protein SecD